MLIKWETDKKQDVVIEQLKKDLKVGTAAGAVRSAVLDYYHQKKYVNKLKGEIREMEQTLQVLTNQMNTP